MWRLLLKVPKKAARGLFNALQECFRAALRLSQLVVDDNHHPTLLFSFFLNHCLLFALHVLPLTQHCPCSKNPMSLLGSCSVSIHYYSHFAFCAFFRQLVVKFGNTWTISSYDTLSLLIFFGVLVLFLLSYCSSNDIHIRSLHTTRLASCLFPVYLSDGSLDEIDNSFVLRSS